MWFAVCVWSWNACAAQCTSPEQPDWNLCKMTEKLEAGPLSVELLKLAWPDDMRTVWKTATPKKLKFYSRVLYKLFWCQTSYISCNIRTFVFKVGHYETNTSTCIYANGITMGRVLGICYMNMIFSIHLTPCYSNIYFSLFCVYLLFTFNNIFESTFC